MNPEEPFFFTDDKYILNEDGDPVPEYNLYAWGDWFEKSGMNRRLKRTEVGDYYVSTVFLGVNYRMFEEGDPILWETMTFEIKESKVDIFGSERMINKEIEDFNGFDRYSTKKEALAGHEEIVEKLKAYIRS